MLRKRDYHPGKDPKQGLDHDSPQLKPGRWKKNFSISTDAGEKNIYSSFPECFVNP